MTTYRLHQRNVEPCTTTELVCWLAEIDDNGRTVNRTAPVVAFITENGSTTAAVVERTGRLVSVTTAGDPEYAGAKLIGVYPHGEEPSHEEIRFAYGSLRVWNEAA